MTEQPRTKRELKICNKIIQYTIILQEDSGPHEEGYDRVTARRKQLYQDLDHICLNDPERYDANMFYIKANIKKTRPSWKARLGFTGPIPHGEVEVGNK
jgi:hypothetical protein